MAFVIADRVKEASASTGTGDLTLAGASVGFQSFGAKCAVGDTLFYGLQAVDAAGAPTGDWECGLGTYSATDTLTRTTVTSSSNGGTLVDLAVGTKEVFITMPARQVAWARERLTANRTYYVSTTGSNSNSGLTVDLPFLTVQKAVDVLATLDMGEFGVTIQLADGTYTTRVITRGYVGRNPPVIQGNATTPANVLINTTNDAITHDAPTAQTWTLKNLKVQATWTGVVCDGTGNTVILQNVDFGACGVAHLRVERGTVKTFSGYKISGSSVNHYEVSKGGAVDINFATVTVLANVTFTVFAQAKTLGVINASDGTFSLGAFAVTGQRHLASTGAVIFSKAASADTYPGNTAGAVATSGQFI